MKIKFLLLLFPILLIACTKQVAKEEIPQSDEDLVSLEIPDKTVDRSKLTYNNKTSNWNLGGQLFSGYAVSYYPNKRLKETFGILNGKRQNEASNWYPDGHLKSSANYHQGRLHGEKKTWSADSSHILIAHLNYHSGKAHGIQKKWYPTGELFKVLELNMGKEEGIQRAFRKNGDLFANYEARNGRIFGLKKASLCFGLEDEKIQYEN